MAQTPEKKVKDKIKKIVKEAGGYYAMPVMAGMAQNGTPDILVCVGGVFIGVEAKANGGKPTKLQTIRLNEIRNTGGLAVVVDEKTVDEFDRLVEWCSMLGDNEGLQQLRDRVPPELVSPFEDS